MIEASNEGETIYLLPTYTAMLEIRKNLKKRYNLKNSGSKIMYELNICHLYPDLLNLYGDREIL